MIAFTCEGCGNAFGVDDKLAGRKSRCRQCGAAFRIPAAEPVLAQRAPRPDPVQAPAAAATVKRKRKQKVGEPRTIDCDAWAALGVGSGLAVLAAAVPPIGFVIQVLMTVIHELGHTATAWLFASPAVPTVDLSYGGGVSLILDRQLLMVITAYAFLTLLLFRAWGDRPELLKRIVYSPGMWRKRKHAASPIPKLAIVRVVLIQASTVRPVRAALGNSPGSTAYLPGPSRSAE
jgi:hypothetical protein